MTSENLRAGNAEEELHSMPDRPTEESPEWIRSVNEVAEELHKVNSRLILELLLVEYESMSEERILFACQKVLENTVPDIVEELSKKGLIRSHLDSQAECVMWSLSHPKPDNVTVLNLKNRNPDYS